MYNMMVQKTKHINFCAVALAFIAFFCATGTVNAEKAIATHELAEIETFVHDVTKAIEKRDFDALQKYMRIEEGVFVSPCYIDTSGDRPRSFDQIKPWLKADSAGAELRIAVRYSWMDKSQWKRIYIPAERIHETPPETITIATEGWNGEEPFVDFTFSRRSSRWVWTVLCYSGFPDPSFPYHQPPKLPRPGPRTFRDYHALYARIEEIIRFRAFDSLPVYAPHGVILQVPCDQSMYRKTLRGKEVSVSKIIDFLKDQTVGGNKIVFTKPGDLPLVLESRGWCCAYPIINFIVRPTAPDLKYEWAGVAYCHSRVPSGPVIIDLPVKSGDGK